MIYVDIVGMQNSGVVQWLEDRGLKYIRKEGIFLRGLIATD